MLDALLEQSFLGAALFVCYNGLMTTVYVYAPALKHQKNGHPEHNGRIGNLLSWLEPHGVLADLTAVSPKVATFEQLTHVHSKGLVEHVRNVCQSGGGHLDHGDTYATRESYDLARLAAGGTCTAVDEILSDRADNGFSLIRPPGHHAERDRISGFCLFNNIAVAAKHAQNVHGLKRIAIVDFDVHHGNGTQDIFYDDPSVLFISTHLYMPRYFYPGSGHYSEAGEGLGKGATLNVPLMPNVGDVSYAAIFEEIIMPQLRAFKPEMILVSAGFDAHWQDPLAMASLSLTGYAQLCRLLKETAVKLCNGRVLFVLEGGYQVDALSHAILNLFYTLLDKDKILDPLGPAPKNEPNITDLINIIKRDNLQF